MYSKAAPWQVQAPCPVPTRNRCPLAPPHPLDAHVERVRGGGGVRLGAD